MVVGAKYNKKGVKSEKHEKANTKIETNPDFDL